MHRGAVYALLFLFWSSTVAATTIADRAWRIAVVGRGACPERVRLSGWDVLCEAVSIDADACPKAVDATTGVYTAVGGGSGMTLFVECSQGNATTLVAHAPRVAAPRTIPVEHHVSAGPAAPPGLLEVLYHVRTRRSVHQPPTTRRTGAVEARDASEMRFSILLGVVIAVAVIVAILIIAGIYHGQRRPRRVVRGRGGVPI